MERYEDTDLAHGNWAKTAEDVKCCCANAQTAIVKLQSMQQKENSPEYFKMKNKALSSLILTERYFLTVFKNYCRKQNYDLNELNEDDFLAFFEEEVEKEFKRYIKTYDSKIAPLEHLFNSTMKRRFPDALEYIRVKAHSGDISLDSCQQKNWRMKNSLEFDFYELLLDISRLITSLHLHGYDRGESGDREKAVSKSKMQYYRMIFTETVSLVSLEQVNGESGQIKHEREIFNTLEVPFLDFYTKDVCRTVYEISHSPLKKYHEIGIEKEGDISLSSVHGGLEAKVYHRYFASIGKNVTEGSVNTLLNRRKRHYYKILEEIKEIWYESFRAYADTSTVGKDGSGKYVQFGVP